MTAREIVKAYDGLPCSVQTNGSRWYNNARGQALRIAAETGKPFEHVVGVIARLSPGVNWEANLVAARELCRFGEVPGYQGYPANVDRARAVLVDGWSEPPRGPKISAFYWNILEPSDPTRVTLDRHMLRLMSWPHDRAPHPAAYSRLALPWFRAARTLGLVTCQVQAALWLAVRDDEVPF